jgi:DNA-binding transcriptional regulator YiaG
MAVKEKVRQMKAAASTGSATTAKSPWSPMKKRELRASPKAYLTKPESPQPKWKPRKSSRKVVVAEFPVGSVPSASLKLLAKKIKPSTVDPIGLSRGLAVEEEEKLATKLVSAIEADSDSPADVTTLCDSYGLRREELGRLTGFSLRALADWAGGNMPSQPARRRLHEIRRLLDALAELVQRDAIAPWLHQKNPAFGSLTPLQVIEVGEMDRLWAMVHERAAGMAD